MQIVHPLVFEIIQQRLPVHQFAFYLDVKVLNWEGSIENFAFIDVLAQVNWQTGTVSRRRWIASHLVLYVRENETFESYIVQKKAFVIKMDQQCKMNSLIEH
ncbi:hypothetical protein T05_12691 [Trichinella murrelli]|uniref:Uncharacterized protein n=1 Tax=Trichinella murrelli TaxID=144512 RepID=A0A0V0TJK6_9BILA|nr:hypothetical protein T05_12691 [Trichinella murrelli]